MNVEIFKDEENFVLIINDVFMGTMPEEEVVETIKEQMEVI